MTNDKVKIQIQAFLMAGPVFCLRSRCCLRERPPHQARFGDGGRRDNTDYVYVGTFIDFISRRRRAGTLPIFFLTAFLG